MGGVSPLPTFDMECFDNLIGIKFGCSSAVPTSGLFINDLPGISLKIADSAINEEDLSSISLINDKLDFAARGMIQDFRNFLEPNMKSRSIVENDTAGFYTEDLKAVALEVGQYKGISAEIYNYGYFDFRINSISVLLDSVVTTNILIINLMTGMVEDVFPVTTIADVPTEVLISKTYPTKHQRLQFLIAIDSGLAGTYQTKLGNRANCTDCNKRYIANNFVRFQSSKIDQGDVLIQKNVKGNSFTNGISLDYNVSCSVEAFICNLQDQLAWPLMFRTGIEILKELKYSMRLNSAVMVHAEDNKELMEDFQTEYEKSMNQIFDNMSIDDTICFECNQTIRTRVQIP